MKKRDRTLWALARCPFLSADDLALMNATRARAARARLLRLCRAGLVEYITLPHDDLHLYYLTSTGIAMAARAAETDAAVLAARYGLDEHALVRRLPGLERLRAGRRILIALHRDLVAHGGTLEQWRAWPVRWRYMQGTHQRVLQMDGEGVVRLPGESTSRWPMGFLWDGDGTVPAAILADRLASLDALNHSETYRGPRASRVPLVLVITADSSRMPPGYRPGLLWTTCSEIGRHGILGAPWRGSALHDGALPLPTALRAAGGADAGSALDAPLPGAVRMSSGEGSVRASHLRQRTQMLRHDGHGEENLFLVAAALPPRGIALSNLVGCHPLLSATDLARAADMNPVDAWMTLALLRRHRLVEAWRPPHDRRTRRHVLTQRGLRLLALRASLTPAAYRRIYGVLDDTEEKMRHGLAFARANLAHTDGINRAFLALLAAARAEGGELEWRGEWACTHTFAKGSRLHTLRPDAEGTYIGPRRHAAFPP